MQLDFSNASVGKLSFQSKLPFPISLTLDVDEADVEDVDDAILILIKIKLGGLNRDSQS